MFKNEITLKEYTDAFPQKYDHECDTCVMAVLCRITTTTFPRPAAVLMRCLTYKLVLLGFLLHAEIRSLYTRGLSF